MGKSALLADLVAGPARAAGALVLSTQGWESESPLAFAALHRLLRPVQFVLDRIAVPQARALRVAFGQEEGPAVDPFLVAVATLSVLTEAAEDCAVLCVVDDAHWLDDASADALLFTARRLQADRVAMVFAVRDGEPRAFSPEGVPSLLLSGLDASATRALLTEHAAAPVPEEVFERLLQQTGGNPLALVELPSQLSAGQLSGQDPMPSRLQLTAGVEQAFLNRCRRLPRYAQTALLVAAADDSGQVATLRRAAELLGVRPDGIEVAERSGLLISDGEGLRVRHPLVRSAIYQAATGLERRQVHRALAQVLGELGDGDRQAWHLAGAADGPDPAVVEALERTAVRAERRGGYVAAAAAFERAAELTAEEQPRGALLFAAARNAWACGQTTRARQLASAARALTDDRLLRADLDRLRARIEVNVGSASQAHRILLQAASSVAAEAPAQALEMVVAAGLSAVYGGDSGLALDETAFPTDIAAGDTARTRCLKLMLAGLNEASRDRWGTAAEALRAALDGGDAVNDPYVLSNLGNTALFLGDDEAAHRYFSRVLAEARDGGAGMLVLYALPRLVFPLVLSGQWAAAARAADEANSLGLSAGQRPLTAAPLACLVLLAALQGNPEYHERLAQVDEVTANHQLGILAGPVLDLTRWAKGIRASHDGDTSAALHHLAQLRQPALIRMAALDRIEAAVRAGERDRATAWVEELSPFADGTGWA